ncbi:MAG: PAS domain S-box protein, partial [Chloroflexi bacterium]|nr:PAS domain S-box protein [Chloroflexota bacterium]
MSAAYIEIGWRGADGAGMTHQENVEPGAKARAERQRSHDHYRMLFEMAPDVIYSLSANGTFTDLSPAFETVTGWPIDEWLGKPFAGIVHPDDLPLAMERFREGLRGETPAPYELRIRSRAGTYLVGEFRNTPKVENGTVVGKVGIARDITERKRVEQALRVLAEASSALASSLDYEITLANVARLVVPRLADWCAVHIVGEGGALERLALAHVDPAREGLGRRLRLPDPLRPGGEGRLEEAVRTGQARIIPEIGDAQAVSGDQDPEHRTLLDDLGLRSAVIVPLVARGRTLGAIAFVSAESGHRYGPEDLIVAQDLARDAALAVDNARLYGEAQEALQRREEFLSIASHELTTPIMALQLQLHMLQRSVARDVPDPSAQERMRRAMEGAERQVKRLAGLTEQLLDVTRLGAGRLELDREEMDLSSLARDVAARFEDQAAAAGSPLSVCAPAPVAGWWDRFRLDQVVTNLLSNAVKYGNGGPIQVAVEADGGVAR